MRSFVLCSGMLFTAMSFATVAMAQENVKKTSGLNNQLSSTSIQNRAPGEYYDNRQSEDISAGWKSIELEEEESGMYLPPEWVDGRVVLKDNSSFDNLKLRYDVYFQQMQFIRNEDTLAFSKPEELNYLLLGTKKFVYIPFDNMGSVENGYFEQMADGKCKLLLRRMIKYHLQDESSRTLEDHYARTCDLYLQKGSDIAKRISPTRKSILTTLDDQGHVIRQFIDDNKLSMRNYQDVILVVNFYNTLK